MTFESKRSFSLVHLFPNTDLVIINTQEVWSFVLFITKSAFRHIHDCMHFFR